MQTNTLDSVVHADWVLGALVGLQGLGPAGASVRIRACRFLETKLTG